MESLCQSAKSLNEIQHEWELHGDKIGKEFTQKLAYYVIGLEVFVCGYLLLYSTSLVLPYKFIKWLFLCSGLAALSGIIWRFFFNNSVYGKCMKWTRYTHGIFVALSILFLVAAIVIGFYSLI